MKFILTRTTILNNYFKIESLEDMNKKLVSKNINGRWKVSEEIIDGFMHGLKEKYKVHMIEINSLEELMEFQHEVGSIVIERFWLNVNYLELEIYDDYRE